MQKLVMGLMAASILALAAPAVVQAQGKAPKIEAKLAAPVAEPRKVIIDGQIWRCNADVCTSAGGGQDQSVKRECTRAVKVLGQVVAYRRGATELAQEEIAACNAG